MPYTDIFRPTGSGRSRSSDRARSRRAPDGPRPGRLRLRLQPDSGSGSGPGVRRRAGGSRCTEPSRRPVRSRPRRWGPPQPGTAPDRKAAATQRTRRDRSGVIGRRYRPGRPEGFPPERQRPAADSAAVSGRVRLKDVEHADPEESFTREHDPAAVRRSKSSPREREAFMTHWAARVPGDPTVLVQAVTVDGEPVGNVVAGRGEGRRRFIGHRLGRRHRGRGIGTRALTLLLEREGTRPLHADPFTGNTGSARLSEWCGCRSGAAVGAVRLPAHRDRPVRRARARHAGARRQRPLSPPPIPTPATLLPWSGRPPKADGPAPRGDGGANDRIRLLRSTAVRPDNARGPDSRPGLWSAVHSAGFEPATF